MNYLDFHKNFTVKTAESVADWAEWQLNHNRAGFCGWLKDEARARESRAYLVNIMNWAEKFIMFLSSDEHEEGTQQVKKIWFALKREDAWEAISFKAPEIGCAEKPAEPQTVWVNLTHHSLTILGEGDFVALSLPPSGDVARVATSREGLGSVAGVPISRATFGEVEGLPSPDGRLFIVSGMVLAQCANRPDVFAPGELVRDGEGKVIGARGLSASAAFIPTSPSQPQPADAPADAPADGLTEKERGDVLGMYIAYKGEWQFWKALFQNFPHLEAYIAPHKIDVTREVWGDGGDDMPGSTGGAEFGQVESEWLDWETVVSHQNYTAGEKARRRIHEEVSLIHFLKDGNYQHIRYTPAQAAYRNKAKGSGINRDVMRWKTIYTSDIVYRPFIHRGGESIDAYKDGDGFVLPEIWWSIANLVHDLKRDKQYSHPAFIDRLPDWLMWAEMDEYLHPLPHMVSEWQKQDKARALRAEAKVYEVKFVHEKGFAFARPVGHSGEDVFIEPGMVRRHDLAKGMQVRITSEKGKKGLQAQALWGDAS